MDWLRYANQGAVRNQQLSPELLKALSFVPEMGLQMEVFSGGQPAKGTSSRRVGSVRHDHGNAADVFFHKDGRRLDWSNPDDLPIFEEIVRKSRGAGITGIGAGPGYMRQGSMHIGFGAPVVWGAGGRSKNVPEWLRNAYYGTEPGTVPAAPTVQMAGQPGQSAPANDPTPMLMAMFGGGGQGSAIGQAGADIPIPNAAPVAAPPPAPMRSTAPSPVQGQTAALAPTVAEGSGMAKTVSTTLAPTPQQIAQRQAMANALAQQSEDIQVIQHPLQGVDKMAKAALSGYQTMRAGQQEKARAEALAGVIGGMGGTTGAYSQQQIAQAAAVDPKIAMGMVQQNRAMEAAAAERAQAANTPKTMQIFDEETGRPMMARVFPDGRVEKLGGVKSDTMSPEAEAQKVRVAEAGRSTSNVTVNGNDGRMGTIPKGHVVVDDPESPAGVKAVPIPGTPAAMDVQKVEDARAAKTAATERSGSVVLQDIDRTLDLMRGDGFLPTTGTMGGMLSNIPGTDAYDAGQLIQTISANTGFDRLQAMRDSSPTGGALGAINQTEMKLLQSALGNLSQYQSKEQIVDNLNRVRNIYLDIIHGPGAGPERRALSFDQSAPDDDFSNMTDEQLEAIANGR